MSPRAELPSDARCVIIGGGVGGASIAYHLAKLGYRDVVLLDRAELTSGSTFHSAGLVGQLRGSVSLTKMMMHSVDVYRGLAAESELDPGWVECGGIRLASSEERMEELRRQAGWAKTFGLPLELISAEEAKQKFPLMSTEGVLGAAWLPTDGYIDPSQLTYALADVARREGGLQVFQNTRVTAIEVESGRARAVETEGGRIEAEVIVNAGGMFAAEIGRMAGIRVPVIPFGHQYLVTQPVREHAADARLPTLRDPDLLVYFREDGGGLVMGGYERDSQPAFLPDGPDGLDAIPPDFNGRLLEDDWDRFAEITENSKIRVPVMDEAKITKLINGPEAFTPDNEFCLGESEVRGLFVAAGFCAHGLAGAGGIGRVMAEWIAEGEPSLDLWEMDVRRFGSQYRSPSYTHARIRETYETYYDIRYPNHERSAGRPLRFSAANAWHAERGAAFGEKSGWERVNWYESNAAAGDESLRPRGWAGHHWSPAIGAEHRATREGVAIFDETSFAKMEIAGPGAADLLERLCDNQVAREVGKITYTQMLNTPRRDRMRLHRRPARRGAVSDRHRDRVRQPRPRVDPQAPARGRHGPGPRRHLGLVVLRDLGPAGARGARPADPGRPLQRRLPVHVGARDHRRQRAGTGAAGHLRRRARLGALLPERVRPRPLAGAVGGRRAARDRRRRLPGDRLDAAGEGLPGLGRRHHPRRDALRGRVGFCVKLDKQGGFIGREALAEAKEAGPRTKLCCLVLADPRSVALGNEPVRIDGEIAGQRDHRRLRLHGRALDRLRLPAARARRARDRGRGRDLRRWVPGRSRRSRSSIPKGERIRA